MMPAIHARYISAAFKNVFSKEAVRIMQIGVKDADALHNHLIKAQHVTENPSAGVRFIKKVGRHVVKTLKKASKSKGDDFDRMIAAALYAEGRRQHAIHDAASHWTNVFFINPEHRTKGFAELLSGKKELPENLVACKAGKLMLESFRNGKWYIMRHILYKKILEKYVAKKRDKIFSSSCHLEQAPHSFVNLDKPKTPADLDFTTRHGFSGFSAASSVSVRHSRKLFDETVRGGLERSIGKDKADRVFGALTTWKPRDPEIIYQANRLGEEKLVPAIREFIDKPLLFDFARKTSYWFGNLTR